jgi:hypothetical protein
MTIYAITAALYHRGFLINFEVLNKTDCVVHIAFPDGEEVTHKGLTTDGLYDLLASL